MNYKEFFNKYNGVKIDFDNAYGYQCVDLFNKYLQEVLNIDNPIQMFPVASAFQIWDYAKNNTNFKRIENTPTAIPQIGDIIIWKKTSSLPHGHVGIFDSGNVNNFKSFDQNWPVGSESKIVNHNYTGVVGWIRSTTKNNNESSDCEIKLSEMRASRDKWKADFNRATAEIKNLKERIKILEENNLKQATEIKTDTNPLQKVISGLDGNKTNLTVIAVIGTITAYQLGYIPENVFVTLDTLFLALIGFSLRDAIRKK